MSTGTGLIPKRGAGDPPELPAPEKLSFGSSFDKGVSFDPNRLLFPLSDTFSTVLDSVRKEGIEIAGFLAG